MNIGHLIELKRANELRREARTTAGQLALLKAPRWKAAAPMMRSKPGGQST